MIWSSLARNRSFDPVVLCFFGRIVPSDAQQNHGPQEKGIHKSNCKFSSSQSLQSQIPPNPKNRLPLNRLKACSRSTRAQAAHGTSSSGALQNRRPAGGCRQDGGPGKQLVLKSASRSRNVKWTNIQTLLHRMAYAGPSMLLSSTAL